MIEPVKESKLVWNAFEWKKWWSMRLIIATTIFASISASYIMLPPDWLPAISDPMKKFFAFGTILTAVASGVARVVKQPNTTTSGS